MDSMRIAEQNFQKISETNLIIKSFNCPKYTKAVQIGTAEQINKSTTK